MKREENPGGSNIMTMAIMAAVAYFGYQYLVSSGMWAQWFGGAQPQPLPAGGGTNTIMQPAPGQAQPGNTYLLPAPQPVPQPAPATSQVASQLQAMANQFMAASGAAGLNVDQWLYYYDIVAHGANPANAASFPLVSAGAANTILGKLGIGIDAASRGQLVTMSQFLGALGGAGLSGIVTVPNQGPIAAPLPTSQNFNRGYGGYPGGTRGIRKGYLN